MKNNLKTYVYHNHYSVHLRLTQYCKSTILPLKKKLVFLKGSGAGGGDEGGSSSNSIENSILFQVNRHTHLDTHNLDHSSQEKIPRSSSSSMVSKLLLYLILEKQGTLTMTIT